MAKPTRKIDHFTQRRLEKYVEEFRSRSGQLPTLRDLESAGFAEELVESALKHGILEQFYVTLTNGTVVKGFKLKK